MPPPPQKSIAFKNLKPSKKPRIRQNYLCDFHLRCLCPGTSTSRSWRPSEARPRVQSSQPKLRLAPQVGFFYRCWYVLLVLVWMLFSFLLLLDAHVKTTTPAKPSDLVGFSTFSCSFELPMKYNQYFVSGFRREKITHKNRKKLRNFMFWSAGCSLLRAQDFCCSFDHRVHRVATVAIWRTYGHEGKICPGWCGWGVHAHPLSLHLPSTVKLQCTL